MVADAPERQETAPGLGLLPLFVFIASLGLLLVAIAGDGARSGAGYADPLFWLGIAVLVLPIAGRQFAASTSRRERIGLVIALGVGAYLVKVMNSPVRFSLHDEFGHVRTTMDILLSGHLYAHNPLVGTYGSYPGLEIVTAAVHQFTGLSVFDSGLVVIGVARLILAVGLFVLLEAVSRSSRIAGIATVVYAANPNFLFFGSIFAYESLAIPLALLAIALALRAAIVTERGAGLIIASGVLILALVPTHHVTSWGVVLTFGLLAGLSVLGQRQRFRLTAPPGSVRRYLPLALVALVAVVAWTALVGGTDTDNSLGPVATNTYHGVADLVTGSSGAKRPFQKTNGAPAETPLEQLTGIGSVLLILASLPLALWILRRRKRLSPIEALTVLAVLAYPFSLAIRLTAAGTETSNRASEFLFVGLAYAVALALTATRRDWTDLRRRPRVAKAFAVGAAAAYLAFIVIGGIIVGWPPYDRLPGTYEPAAGSRSVDPYTVSAARWAGANLPRKTAIVSDSVNGSLAIAQGLNPQRGKVRGTPVARIFFTRTLDPADRAIIRFDHIRYLIVDRRLHQSLPLQGRYFEGGDPAGFKLHGGIPLRALTKFEGAPGSYKVYDNGPVSIYDVRAIANGSAR